MTNASGSFSEKSKPPVKITFACGCERATAAVSRRFGIAEGCPFSTPLPKTIIALTAGDFDLRLYFL